MGSVRGSRGWRGRSLHRCDSVLRHWAYLPLVPTHDETYHPEDYQAPAGSWASSDPIRRTMVHNRGKNTGPELAIRSEVHRRGLRYRVNARPLPGIRRSADLVFTAAHVAVFVDGCFWHRCPTHFRMPATNTQFWTTKIESNELRDRETDSLLASSGWTVVRVWEHESVADAANLIQAMVRRAKASSTSQAAPWQD
jgi:DNA mismatch endonuclease, patch repair protein